MAEVMADKHAAHVDPVHLKILVKVKGIDNIILITDSLFPAGFQEGVHEGSDGRRVIVYKNDVNRLEENNFLAGSVMSMNMAVKNMMNHTGIALTDAVKMASANPARLLGIDDRKGSIKEGMDADITVIDDDINIILTMVGGDVVYDSRAYN
jgi:N-acetylglucosamine-6-phosphate deacetylase